MDQESAGRVAELHFFYDFVCPYAYLASLRVDEIARRTGAKLVFHPMLLGGVFRAIGAPDHPHMSAGRARYNALDLARQAKAARVTLHPPENHPRRTVLALRAAIASGQDLAQATCALFDAYWGRGEDIENDHVVRAALERSGLDGRAIVERATTLETKEALRRSTDHAVKSGIFGAPAMVVSAGERRELFWGNDRLPFVERALMGRGPEPSDDSSRSPTGAAIELYFDFSSPFAYLGSTQVRRLARRVGARLEYKPILLGGLFKAIGTGNVPLFEMPAPKQQHVAVDLDRWAECWKVPFRFASRFPINTTKALRAVLLAPIEARPDLVDAIFEAAWGLDRDITSDSVLGDILTRVGCEAGTILSRVGEAEVKQALKESTDEAEKRGVFGVPTFFVRSADRDEEMYWGQDRIPMIEASLAQERG